jgi:hypothetical protein
MNLTMYCVLAKIVFFGHQLLTLEAKWTGKPKVKSNHSDYSMSNYKNGLETGVFKISEYVS